MTAAMRHLLLIDTASRMAHNILHGRIIGDGVFLHSMAGPDEVERLRAGNQSARVFDWLREELLLAMKDRP